MDRLSFVISLLLIFSVTTATFGSVIQAKNPNGESLKEPRSDSDLFPNMALKELEALLKRSHHQSNPDMKTDAQAKLQGQNGLKDQESEIPKRVDPETLIPGKTTVALQEERRNNLDGYDFQIAICIENQSGYEWTTLSQYIAGGTEPEHLPVDVLQGGKVLASSYSQQKVAGLVVYYIEEIQSSLAVLYYVSNDTEKWYVEMYNADHGASHDMYVEMYAKSYDADNQFHDGPLQDGLTYHVSMSPYPQATLEILISKAN